MALRQRHPGDDLLHHSDRGSTYASGDYRKALEKEGIECSMSRKGHCWDNAVAESFFATLKREIEDIDHLECWDVANILVGECIDGFYNLSIGQASPLFPARHLPFKIQLHTQTIPSGQGSLFGPELGRLFEPHAVDSDVPALLDAQVVDDEARRWASRLRAYPHDVEEDLAIGSTRKRQGRLLQVTISVACAAR